MKTDKPFPYYLLAFSQTITPTPSNLYLHYTNPPLFSQYFYAKQKHPRVRVFTMPLNFYLSISFCVIIILQQKGSGRSAFLRKEVMPMEVYQALALMISFATLVVLVLSFPKRK
ncbi:putative holin-like toxin [Pelotomaculum terephthalicicum]|uniref:putative holin-like toxin n=1 Tax=Pelotomaculum terephthalicicum TaxID=206393 RepID=UPI0035E3F3F7